MPDLIVCSLEPWDEIWRRNQFLIDGLMHADPDQRVLFVEPSSDPLYTMARRGRPRLGLGLRAVPGYDGRLSRLGPTKWLPRSFGPIANHLLAGEVLREAARLCMHSPVLWINDPGWAHLVSRTGWPAIYDITDDWVAADRPAREHARIVANEATLMRLCRVVVVCSAGLERSKSKVRPVVLVPNAVEVSRYRTPLPRPDDLGRGRVALYVGTLHEDRLDVELCVRLGRALVEFDAELVLAGPNALSDRNSNRLSAAGVRLLGARPYPRIPAYLQHADVLVVPHRVYDFTESLDPIKLYEYTAVGRPIAATPVAGFRELAVASGVAIRSAAELPDAVLGLLTHPPAVVGPFEVADWSDRVASMAAVLQLATK